MAERVVGHGSFGVVFQAKCLETGETVAIKKVLQDKEVQEPGIANHASFGPPECCIFEALLLLTTEKDELYLNLVLECVPDL